MFLSYISMVYFVYSSFVQNKGVSYLFLYFDFCDPIRLILFLDHYKTKTGHVSMA